MSTIKQDINYSNVCDLNLDSHNPRFGEDVGKLGSQKQVLDHLVKVFGIDDVLSSLAVNGYFNTEPIICQVSDDDGALIVKEGNRRLAACLILTGDERASNQRQRTEKYQELHKRHGSPQVDPIPTIIISAKENPTKLLSYLGVRHIASSQPWDSFAKASWIAGVMERTELSIDQIAEMIGDQNKAVMRLLLGYHFIYQLINRSLFDPADSARKGRGSNSSFPFSWVYTILGYRTIQSFLHIDSENTDPDPIPEEYLDEAALVVNLMFGNKSMGMNSALTDSRQLRLLAMAVDNVEKLNLLKQGRSITEIEVLTQPISERLTSGLLEVQSTLRELSNKLVEFADSLPDNVARDCVEISERVKRLATEVNSKLNKLVNHD